MSKLSIRREISRLVNRSKRSDETSTTGDIARDVDFMTIYSAVKAYTMTSIERMYSLYKAIHFIVENEIVGDFVECGVWKGGSSMIMALTLNKLNVRDRKIFMYDTFEGMSKPTERDKDIFGNLAASLLASADKKSDDIWCFSTVDEVKKNVVGTGYPADNFLLIPGKVEDTIPEISPTNIALLRLDTDWYESTSHEMTYLYPHLVSKGILLVDDYGHWEGARRAVDEYFSSNAIRPFLFRVDYTCRLMIKI